MHMHMYNCNSRRACEVYVRMRLAARAPTQAARRWLGQSGELPHAHNKGPGFDGPGAPPAVGPMLSQIAGSGVHAAILGKWWPMSRQDAVVTTTRVLLTPLRRSASAHQ